MPAPAPAARRRVPCRSGRCCGVRGRARGRCGARVVRGELHRSVQQPLPLVAVADRVHEGDAQDGERVDIVGVHGQSTTQQLQTRPTAAAATDRDRRPAGRDEKRGAVRVGRQSAGCDVQRLLVSAQVGQRVGASEGLGLGSRVALHGGRVCQTPFGGSPTRIPSEGGRRPGAASDAVGGRRHPPFLVVGFVLLYAFPGRTGELFAWPIAPDDDGHAAGLGVCGGRLVLP